LSPRNGHLRPADAGGIETIGHSPACREQRPDLASVQDVKNLAELSEVERPELHAWWLDVDAILNKIEIK
jgi:hypothetical protein